MQQIQFLRMLYFCTVFRFYVCHNRRKEKVDFEVSHLEVILLVLVGHISEVVMWRSRNVAESQENGSLGCDRERDDLNQRTIDMISQQELRPRNQRYESQTFNFEQVSLIEPMLCYSESRFIYDH